MGSARNRREWSAIGAAYAAERTQLQFGEQLCLDVVEAHLDGRSVLDAGCGSGFLAREMARRGARVFGIDISHELLRRARSLTSNASHPNQYAVHDLTVPMPFPDEAFDVAVSAMTLMDVEDPLLAVKHVTRVIRPGGRVAFSILHPCFYRSGVNAAGDGVDLGVYFDRDREERRTIALDPVRLSYRQYHRTLGDYVNTMIDCGLTITGLVEPEHESDAQHQRHLLIHAVK